MAVGKKKSRVEGVIDGDKVRARARCSERQRKDLYRDFIRNAKASAVLYTSIR